MSRRAAATANGTAAAGEATPVSTESAGRHSWFHPRDSEGSMLPAGTDLASVRLWHGFMTARVMMAGALLLLQALIHALGQPVSNWTLAVCGAYLLATLAMRLFGRPELPGRSFSGQWVGTIGSDVLAYSALQMLQSGSMNYAPLFGLPLLLASVLGSRLLALGTAAAITLLLLGEAWWTSLNGASEGTSRLLQAGLTGLGYFIVAFLGNQLAARLAREEQLARRSEVIARLQAQVSELVIETLSDGVLVVDLHGAVRAANPAARLMLGGRRATSGSAFALGAETAWWPLLDLARSTLEEGRPQTADISIHHTGQSPRRVRVRTRMTVTPQLTANSLCVMFLHDLREMEARLRTEKLAAMGRMSAAVAHEIRNPLAAIVQANALLDEDLHDPAHKQLAAMVRQNAQRLAKIAEDVLDISRVQRQSEARRSAPLPLDETVEALCREWGLQARRPAPTLALQCPGAEVEFEPDHLRRVLVNLLDNARRYIGEQPDALQVATQRAGGGQIGLEVWSDGLPLEKSVEQHLFEPFFSSESRSTGLGLYICRELCERHGASIGYQRAARHTARGLREGNAFVVTFRSQARPGAALAPLDAVVV